MSAYVLVNFNADIFTLKRTCSLNAMCAELHGMYHKYVYVYTY